MSQKPLKGTPLPAAKPAGAVTKPMVAAIAALPFTKSEGGQRGKANFEKEPNVQTLIRVYEKQDKTLAMVMVESVDKLPASTIAVYPMKAHQSEKGGITYNTENIELLRHSLVQNGHLTAEQAATLTPGKRGSFYLKKA